jgi:Tfp pilus assembly protein FimT
MLEFLLVLGFFALVASLTYLSFLQFNQNRSLNAAALNVVSALDEARGKSLASLEASEYGVHLDETSVTLFKGSQYVIDDPNNRVTALPSGTSISGILLASGGSDVVFSRVTGVAQTTGTITISLTSDPSESIIITIEASGLVRIGSYTPLVHYA